MLPSNGSTLFTFQKFSEESVMMRGCFCALLLAIVPGCTGGDPGEPLDPTVPVSGTVTLDGNPLASATVTFVPQGSGTECIGSTDDSGKYTLRQPHGAEGAPVGNYKVAISQFLRGDGTPLPEDGAGEGGVATESLPPRYSDPLETILTASVPEGGSDAINFELTSE